MDLYVFADHAVCQHRCMKLLSRTWHDPLHKRSDLIPPFSSEMLMVSTLCYIRGSELRRHA
jgi:hypothetical protein